MGKAPLILEEEERRRTELSSVVNSFAVQCECCTPILREPSVKGTSEEYEWKELVVVGGGPHSLSLVLRLLEPDADLLPDKKRHVLADHKNRMRPLGRVRKHIKDLGKGPKAVFKPKDSKGKAHASSDEKHPPLSLEFARENVLVVDATLSDGSDSIHSWMSGWNHNFKALGIGHLRSPTMAHADPFDHRALEFFAYKTKRGTDVVQFKHLERGRGQWDFHGPYDAPSTSCFREFHELLVTGYGVEGMVQPGRVTSIRLVQAVDSKYPYKYRLSIQRPSGDLYYVETPRIVSAMGPAVSSSPLDSLDLPKDSIDNVTDRVLLPNQIVPFLLGKLHEKKISIRHDSPRVLAKPRILIVGGGQTSAHLALVAASRCDYESVTLIQRSKCKERQFDLDLSWMGPGRGRLLERFWSLPMAERVDALRMERGGGTISPEVVRLLEQRLNDYERPSERAELLVKEQVEIVDVEISPHDNTLHVTFDDDQPGQFYDMIWLSTGFQNIVSNYPCLSKLLSEDLPVDVVGGLPVLGQSLELKAPAAMDDEPFWKHEARKRFWLMGPLAALELGPDALNLMGGRQGAVRIAKSLRSDLREVTKIK